MFRIWIKSIISECLNEQLRDQPLVISNRAPCPDDVYERGTMWKHGSDIYQAKKVTVEWVKHE